MIVGLLVVCAFAFDGAVKNGPNSATWAIAAAIALTGAAVTLTLRLRGRQP
jgi:hypothetical protein